MDIFFLYSYPLQARYLQPNLKSKENIPFYHLPQVIPCLIKGIALGKKSLCAWHFDNYHSIFILIIFCLMHCLFNIMMQ